MQTTKNRIMTIEQLQELILESLKDTLIKDQNNPYIEEILISINSNKQIVKKLLTENFYDVIASENLVNDQWQWKANQEHIKNTITNEFKKFNSQILNIAEKNDKNPNTIKNKVKKYLLAEISESDLAFGYNEAIVKLTGNTTLIDTIFIDVYSVDDDILNNSNNFNLIKINKELVHSLNKLKITPLAFIESYLNHIKKVFIENNILNEHGEYLINKENIDDSPLYLDIWIEYLKKIDTTYLNYFENNNFNDAIESIYAQLTKNIYHNELNPLHFEKNDCLVNVDTFVQNIIHKDNYNFIKLKLASNIAGYEVEDISKNIGNYNIQLNNDMDYNYIRINGELQNNETGESIKITNLIIKNTDIHPNDNFCPTEYEGTLKKLYSDNTYSLINSIHEYNLLNFQNKETYNKSFLNLHTKIEQQINNIKNNEILPFDYLKKNVNSNSIFFSLISQKEIDNNLYKKIIATLQVDDKEKKAKEIANIIINNKHLEQHYIQNIIKEHLLEPLNNLEEHPIYYCYLNIIGYGGKIPPLYLDVMFPEHCLFLNSKNNKNDVLNILLEYNIDNVAKKIIEHPNFNPKKIINEKTYLFSTTNIDIQILLASKGVDPTYTDPNNNLATDAYYNGYKNYDIQHILQQKFLEQKILKPDTQIKKLKI